MIRTLALTAIVAMLLAAPALAGDNEDSPALRACLEKAHAHRPIAHCYAQEIDRLEAAVEADYRAALAAAPDARTRTHLEAEQKLWAKDTEAKCAAAASSNKGELGSMRGQSCNLDANRERDQALRARLHH
jgi:uncharacterized protein YecT (DUF1311 family)